MEYRNNTKIMIIRKQFRVEYYRTEDGSYRAVGNIRDIGPFKTAKALRSYLEDWHDLQVVQGNFNA